MSLDNIERTSVTLKMLIDDNILIVGQEIFCSNPNISGFVNGDGSITVRINGEQKIFDYLSGAARHIEKRSLNGWIYWYVINGDEKQTIDTFRDQYLKGNRNSKST